jgi:hypothetical protein
MGLEAFHSHFNRQFYSTHLSIFTFIDVITKIQTTTYVKMRCLNVDAALRKPEKERISFLLRQFEMYSVGELNVKIALNIVKMVKSLKTLKVFTGRFE